MIKIKPATRPHGIYVCNCCFSDNDTKEIHLSADGTMGIVIILCKNCRAELIDAIRADDSEVGA
jgi:hypothetical protein